MITLRNSVWWADFYDSSGRRIRKSLKTTDKKIAKELAAKLMAGETGKPLSQNSSSSPTLEEAWIKAHAEYGGWREAKSQATLEGTWKQVALHFGGDTLLSSIDTRAMTAYAGAMREAGLSGSTINQRMSFISILFKQAITMWGYEKLTMPTIVRAKVAEGRTRRITAEEELKVLEWFKRGLRPRHNDMADLVAFLLDTGMRLSEALRVNDASYCFIQGSITIWENKGDRPRAVPMTPRVRAILTRRKNMTTPFGMFTVDSAEHEWDWVRTKMDLDADKEFVLHVLRHTVGSRLADAGVDGFIIQKFLGHKSITTTQKYIHVSVAGMNKATEVLTKLQTQIPRDRDVTKPEPFERRRDHAARRRRANEPLLIRRSLVRAQVGEPKE